MPLNLSTVHSLRRVFNEGFSAEDIAEPLVSFDATTAARTVQEFMSRRGFEVVGVRDQGLVVGYLVRSELGEGACGDYLRNFEDNEVVAGDATFTDVVMGLEQTPRLFVALLGRVSGIITRSDLQKPPVRMWLFGMITLTEMRFTRLIERRCPDESWKAFLSPGRLQKTEELLKERMRRNQHLGLIDCLQFADKGQIIAANEEIRSQTRFQSKRQIQQLFKKLERLRNNLAHSQDIVAGDWETIVLLSENLEVVLLGPPGMRE